MELIDLSQTVAAGGFERPFHPKVAIEPMMTHEESSKKFLGKFSFAAMKLTLSDHTGSHVDALSHYVPGDAPSIDQLPLRSLLFERDLRGFLGHRPQDLHRNGTYRA